MVQCCTTQVALAKYPHKTAKILHRDIFWFFLRDEEFVSKTINDRNIDLNKFPASKVHKLSKTMKVLKLQLSTLNKLQVTDKQPKYISCNPQHTELPPCKFQRKQKKHFKTRQDTNKQYSHKDNDKQYY